MSWSRKALEAGRVLDWAKVQYPDRVGSARGLLCFLLFVHLLESSASGQVRTKLEGSIAWGLDGCDTYLVAFFPYGRVPIELSPPPPIDQNSEWISVTGLLETPVGCVQGAEGRIVNPTIQPAEPRDLGVGTLSDYLDCYSWHSATLGSFTVGSAVLSEPIDPDALYRIKGTIGLDVFQCASDFRIYVTEIEAEPNPIETSTWGTLKARYREPDRP